MEEIKESAEDYDIIEKLELENADAQTQQIVKKAFEEGLDWGSTLTVDIYNGETPRKIKYKDK